MNHPPDPKTLMQPDSLAAYAPATRRTYHCVWKHFLRWNEAQGRHQPLPMPPEQLLDYLNHLAAQGRRWSTIETHKSVIVKAHRRAGLPSPADGQDFKDELRGLARTVGKRQSQVQALTEAAASAVAATAHIPRRGRGGNFESQATAARRASLDNALVSVMRDGLLRSDEAAHLRWTDLETLPDGTGRILIRRSKTDQSGQGALLFLSRASVSALERIAPAPGDVRQDTPIFRLSSTQIRRRLKQATAAAGLPGNYGGHSPRIGMAVDLAQTGTGLPEIQQAGRWESPNMPARYIRGIAAGQGAVARYSAARNR